MQSIPAVLSSAVRGRGLLGTLALAIGLLAGCSSSASLQTGAYMGKTSTGQPVILTFSPNHQGVLYWGQAGPGERLPVTVSLSGSTVTVDLGLGLKITGHVRGSTAFSLTYPQYGNGEPELGQPSQTISFWHGAASA